MSYGLGCGPWSSSAPVPGTVPGGLRATRARTIGFSPSLGFLGRGPRGGDRPPRRPLLLLLLAPSMAPAGKRQQPVRCRARAAYRPTVSLGPPCTDPSHRELRWPPPLVWQLRHKPAPRRLCVSQSQPLISKDAADPAVQPPTATAVPQGPMMPSRTPLVQWPPVSY